MWASNFLDQISELALLVIDVVQHFHVGTAHSLRDLKRLGHAIQVDGRVLNPVDGFDDRHQAGAAKHIRGAFERLNGCRMLAPGGGALDALTREQNDLLALQSLGGRDEILQRREERIPSGGIREAGAHAGGRIHRDLQCLHAREDAAIVLLGPFLEFPDQFHVVVTSLRNALQVFFKGTQFVQRPNHDGELCACLARIGHSLCGEVSGARARAS
jgi:hypothetical protein